jgi:hypothetical protein
MSILWKIGCLNTALAVIVAAAGGHKDWEIERKLIFNSAFILHLASGIGIILASLKEKTIPAVFFIIG